MDFQTDADSSGISRGFEAMSKVPAELCSETGQRDESVANEPNNSEPQFLKSAPNMTRSPERRPSFNYRLCS